MFFGADGEERWEGVKDGEGFVECDEAEDNEYVCCEKKEGFSRLSVRLRYTCVRQG